MQKRNPFCRSSVLVLVVIIGTFLSLYQIMNWRGEREWQQHFQGADSIELRQRVSDELNFAKTPLLENHGYRDRGAPMPANGLNTAHSLIRWSAIGDFRQETFSHLGESLASREIALSKEDVRSAEELLEEMGRANGAITELLEAAKRPYSRFDMELSFEGPIPNFVLIRTISQVFHYRALCFLARDDHQEAMAQLRVLEQIIEGLRGSPTLVAAMIRNAVIGLELQPFYEGWARRQWRAEDYKKLQGMFEAAGCLENFDFSLRSGEREGVRQFVEKHAGGEMAGLLNITGVDEDKEPMRALLVNGYFHSMPRGWWKKNVIEHHRILDGMQTNLYDMNSRLIFSQNGRRVMQRFDGELKSAMPFHHVAAVAIPNFHKALQVVGKLQATCDQMMIVCALELYALENKEYPVKLESLVPEFISALPKDLVSGAPPIYRRNDDGGFILYSAGWDGQDNGGNGQPNDYMKAGQDLVWPYRRAQL